MENILEDIKKYFKDTPREKIMQDWEETAKYDEVGPRIDQFIKVSKSYPKIKFADTIYQSNKKQNNFLNPELTLRVSN